MAVPKRRVSHARQGKRRSHLGVKPSQVAYCGNCGFPARPHRVCSNCGFYQGREFLKVEQEK
ncbi:50S ribosomal protein L32 [bacterium]|jgi:large subunit ribosomal protein L32|nr:50S ribosomal protein L32 [bacterium]